MFSEWKHMSVAPSVESVVNGEDRYCGCLLGLAIGDALGMPFEGLDPQTISTQHGQVKEFLPGYGLAAGQYTDDTIMALCMAESVVQEGRVASEDIAQRFVAWFDSGDLRGIGNTCRESILNLKGGTSWRESGVRGEWAAGNGTAMRIAPIGLLDCHNMERLREDCWTTSIITHDNPEAVAGATAVAYVIAHLVTNDLDKENLLSRAADFVGESEVARNLFTAQDLLRSGTPTAEALAILGTGGYVVETVASALYCFLRTPTDFSTTVSAAVMGGGDTDTTAAVAGAISGTYNGLPNLPPQLVAQVEDCEKLQDLGRAIFRLAATDRRP
jgi:ADP-ribosyl-[dinitrogen reductase] hydrolase